MDNILRIHVFRARCHPFCTIGQCRSHVTVTWSILISEDVDSKNPFVYHLQRSPFHLFSLTNSPILSSILQPVARMLFLVFHSWPLPSLHHLTTPLFSITPTSLNPSPSTPSRSTPLFPSPFPHIDSFHTPFQFSCSSFLSSLFFCINRSTHTQPFTTTHHSQHHTIALTTHSPSFPFWPYMHTHLHIWNKESLAERNPQRERECENKRET